MLHGLPVLDPAWSRAQSCPRPSPHSAAQGDDAVLFSSKDLRITEFVFLFLKGSKFLS